MKGRGGDEICTDPRMQGRSSYNARAGLRTADLIATRQLSHANPPDQHKYANYDFLELYGLIMSF